MPFKSEKQRKWMWANDPEMAEKWANEEDEIEEVFARMTKSQLGRIINEASSMKSGFLTELQTAIDQALAKFDIEPRADVMADKTAQADDYAPEAIQFWPITAPEWTDDKYFKVTFDVAIPASSSGLYQDPGDEGEKTYQAEPEEFIKSENTMKITKRQLRRIIREASALHAEDEAYERGYEAGYKGAPEAERSIEYLGGYDAGFLDADQENHKN